MSNNTLNNNQPSNQQPQHQVGLLIHDGVWAASVYSALDLFESANRRNLQQLFNCTIVSPNSSSVKLFNGREMLADSPVNDQQHFDLIFLSHYWGSFDDVTSHYPELPSWLRKQYERGAVIAGINSGIVWAAQAGLLRNRSATSYWRNIKEFRRLFPDVTWAEQQSLVEDSGIYSSNGQNAAMDLTLHLIEKFSSSQMADRLARDITYDSRRSYDLTLFNMSGFRQHKDNAIHKAQDWLDSRYNEPFNFGDCSKKLNMSQRNFIRRFQAATGEKPSRYLQRLRVESAKHQLINNDDSIKAILLNVGYQNFGHFSKVFKEYTKLSPRQFRARFRPGV